MPAGSPDAERVRAAEVIASLCLATDLGMGLPLMHGLQSTLFATRLGERLGIDQETSRHAYYACMLFHAGCTTDAEIAAEIFGAAMVEHSVPAMFASRPAMLAGLLGSLPPAGSSLPRSAFEIARRAPRAARTARPHFTAACEVAEMLARRLGLPVSLSSLFSQMSERWDGKGPLRRASHDADSAGRADRARRSGCGGSPHAGRRRRRRAGRARARGRWARPRARDPAGRRGRGDSRAGSGGVGVG